MILVTTAFWARSSGRLRCSMNSMAYLQVKSDATLTPTEPFYERTCGDGPTAVPPPAFRTSPCQSLLPAPHASPPRSRVRAGFCALREPPLSSRRGTSDVGEGLGKEELCFISPWASDSRLLGSSWGVLANSKPSKPSMTATNAARRRLALVDRRAILLLQSEAALRPPCCLRRKPHCLTLRSRIFSR